MLLSIDKEFSAFTMYGKKQKMVFGTGVSELTLDVLGNGIPTFLNIHITR